MRTMDVDDMCHPYVGLEEIEYKNGKHVPTTVVRQPGTEGHQCVALEWYSPFSE